MKTTLSNQTTKSVISNSTTLKSAFSKSILSLSLVLLLSACGGGGGGSSDSNSNSGSSNNKPQTNNTNTGNGNSGNSNTGGGTNNGNSNSTNGNQTGENATNGNNNNTLGINLCKNSIGNYSMCEEYILPPMPNKKENDKTLLGIDSNNNGVRDDVEHYIFNRFKDSKNYRVEREIAMQRARATQLFMINPETGYQDGKYKLTHKMVRCLFYYYDEYLSANNITGSRDALLFMSKNEITDSVLDDIIFNNRDRIKAYYKYNSSLSGRMFKNSYPKAPESCEFDIDSIIVF